MCAAYLGIYDNDRRLADHFGGKLHLGFIEIREKLDELRKAVDDHRKLGKANRERQERKDEDSRRDNRDRDRPRDNYRDRDRQRRKRYFI